MQETAAMRRAGGHPMACVARHGSGPALPNVRELPALDKRRDAASTVTAIPPPGKGAASAVPAVVR